MPVGFRAQRGGFWAVMLRTGTPLIPPRYSGGSCRGMNNVPNSFKPFKMRNRLKYKESSIFVDTWFIKKKKEKEKAPARKKGDIQPPAGEIRAEAEGTALLCSGIADLSWGGKRLCATL